MKEEIIRKVTIIGDYGVGKTSIINNKENYIPNSTIGTSYINKEFIINDTIIKMQIWDTAGQERYHSLIPIYLRGSDVVIIVYSVNDENSYNSVIKWLKFVINNIFNDNIIIYIVGNKIDLPFTESSHNIKNYINEIKLKKTFKYPFNHKLVCAKDKLTINELFISICESIININDSILSIENKLDNLVIINNTQSEKYSDCCY